MTHFDIALYLSSLWSDLSMWGQFLILLNPSNLNLMPVQMNNMQFKTHFLRPSTPFLKLSEIEQIIVIVFIYSSFRSGNYLAFAEYLFSKHKEQGTIIVKRSQCEKYLLLPIIQGFRYYLRLVLCRPSQNQTLCGT